MIKARGTTKDGRDLVILGLSHENVARLFADEPILVRTAEPGPTGVGLEGGPDVAVIVGKDEGAIVAKLRSYGLAR
jgi:hypothetical protein